MTEMNGSPEMVVVSHITILGVDFAIAIPAASIVRTARMAANGEGWHYSISMLSMREINGGNRADVVEC